MIVPVEECNLRLAGMVHSESWKASHGFCTPEFVEKHTPEAQTEYLRREISAGKTVFLLMQEEPIGIVSVWGDVIENLYVRPGFQGRGHGTALLRFALDRCGGTPRLWVLNSNTGAMALYRRLGFRETGAVKYLNERLCEVEMSLERLAAIRSAEARSHTEAYSAYTLYAPGSWLSKPVKALRDLLPLYQGRSGLKALDLGCGVGRNAIAAARTGFAVEGVDILPMAIEKLRENAECFGVAHLVRGVVSPVDHWPIEKAAHDLIIAASVLEHLDSAEGAFAKLQHMKEGIRPGGGVCIVMNTGVREWDAATGEPLPPQFEVNLPPEMVLAAMDDAFEGWEILTRTLIHQEYDVPRGNRTATISSEVVTFAARMHENE